MPSSSLSLSSEVDGLADDPPAGHDAQSHGLATKEITTISQQDASVSRQRARLDVVGWWIPEIIASTLSVASFASIVVVLLIYDRHAVAGLNMLSGITLNGIIALLATVSRVGLCAPVCSGLLQETWLFFARESRRTIPKSRLRDFELFFKASYGTLGSLEFLLHLTNSK